MILCIYLIIVCITCYYYNIRKYTEFIVSSFAICSNVFGILPNPDPLKVTDFFTLIIFFVLLEMDLKSEMIK